MGITLFSYNLIKKAKQHKPDINSVLEFGSQNDYTMNLNPPPFADHLYKSLGIQFYSCIDLAGDNKAIKADLSNIIPPIHKYSLVSDFGTSEHIVKMRAFQITPFCNDTIHSIYPTEVEDIERGYYNSWVNKFSFCELNGIIICENPLTGNWPGHGYSYLGRDFYTELEKNSSLRIIDQGTDPAMGNTTDGWNIWAILEKTGEKFPLFEQFNKLPIFRS